MIKNLIQKYKSQPALLIQKAWEHLSKIPKGNVLFSKLLTTYIPYSGSIYPLVQEFKEGHACVYMPDRRGIHNHLDSVHASAIANLGEFVTSLALVSKIKGNEKVLIVKLAVEYIMNARNALTAEATFIRPEIITTGVEFEILSEIKNLKNDIVAKVTTTWKFV